MERVEIVIQGDEEKIYGFVTGFAAGRDMADQIIPCQDYNISTEHHPEGISRYLGIGGKYTNFIIPKSLRQPLEEALQGYGSDLGLEVEEVRDISGLSFSFSGKIYSEGIAEQVKTVLENRVEKIELSDYEPQEIKHKEAEGHELYAPEHNYEYRVSAKVSGPFTEVLAFYRQLEQFDQIHLKKMRCQIS